MTLLVFLFAAYAAFAVAGRTYPATVGETINHGGTPISPRGALLLAAALGFVTFSIIAMPWLLLVPQNA